MALDYRPGRRRRRQHRVRPPRLFGAPIRVHSPAPDIDRLLNHELILDAPLCFDHGTIDDRHCIKSSATKGTDSAGSTRTLPI
jgi:hypothetical protein